MIEEGKWIHIIKADNKFYVSGKLTDVVKEFAGYDFTDFTINPKAEGIWIKLRKRG